MVICTAPAAMFATIALASRMKRTSDRKSTRLNSSHLVISYAVFCLKKKSPLFGEVPVSLTHIAFPLGYGATGMVGWRFPGVFLYHDLRPGKPMTVQLQVAAFKGSGPGVGASGVGSGEASGVPQFETRFNFAKRLGKASWNGYVGYHADNKDVNGVGVKGGQLNGWGVETGHAVTSGKVPVPGKRYHRENPGPP